MIESVATVRGPLGGVAGASDPGRVRQGNEDRLHYDLEHGLFVVADGVGGRAAGEVASAIAVEVIADSVTRFPGSPEQRVREAITRANNEIHRQAQVSDARRGMTCVLTAALLTGDRLTIGQVGDSRLYKITAGGISKMTRDHSPVGEQEDRGEISEDEAMRHPRRNEVFRDVGATEHQPDDPEFIEIVEAVFEPESAILLCSDGLSDMLPSAAIDAVVREHAGSPVEVVHALIAAANEAGGRDNITALYVEGTAFASVAAPLPALADERSRAGAGTRLLWLFFGVLMGLAAAVGIAAAFDLLPGGLAGRTLVVGGTSTGFGSIGAAMAAAGPRDTVQIEPGTYQEEVVLPDGVSLRATVAGTVRLIAPPGRLGWVSLTSTGARGNAVSGVRIVGTPEAPIATGLKLAGQDTSIEDVTLEGNIDVGIDVQNDGASVLRASRFQEISGLPLRIAGSARPVVRQNLFIQGARETGPAVHVQDAARPTLDGNVFVGYTEAIGAPPSQREHLVRGNFIARPAERHPAERIAP
jgi:serine/threonine protein phosphatase PrpC